MSRRYRPWWAGQRLLPFCSDPKRAKRRHSKRGRQAGKAEIRQQRGDTGQPTAGNEDPRL